MNGQEMIGHMKAMWDFPRSITGHGTRKTLDYLKDLMPGLDILAYASGSQVFDWEIPDEWNIYDAYIEHESGARFAQFSDSTLHIMGYSIPCDLELDREELLEHIHTQPDQPDAIPYVTSYYADRWGFCMSEKEKQSLPPGRYRVVIQADKGPGHLHLGELLLPGKRRDEIFFSTYVCHPAMANDQLSGPVTAAALAHYITTRLPDREYSYRFVLLPETIGSIAYLSDHAPLLRERVKAGFVLSCTGDDRAFGHVQSRLGNSLADQALEAALLGKKNVSTSSFLDRGSDERQYCAPGIDLPVCGFCRSKYDTFPEYHTSADNFDVVTAQGLQGSLDLLVSIVEAFETGLYPRVTTLGEPQLGKRGLYPTLSRKGSADEFLNRTHVIAYSDGNHSLFDLVRMLDMPLTEVTREVRILKDHDLLRTETHASAENR